MKKTIVTLTLIIFLFSCETHKSHSERIRAESVKDSSEVITKNHLNFNTIVKIDSILDYVMYPLEISKEAQSDLGGSYGESSYGRKNFYWNIIFYNTKTQEYHLLDDNKKMLISSYDFNVQSSMNSNYEVKFHKMKGNNIYYDITVLDYNKDGHLDSKDPHYLFMSDNEGRNFKQISPDSMSVNGWNVIEKTGKLLIQARKDTDGDKLFNNEDEIIPFVFDLKSGENIKEIFNPKFKKEAQKLFEKQFFKNK